MKKEKRYAVLGLGLFGTALAKTLAKNGVEVIGMDQNMDHVEENMDHVSFAIQGDFTKLSNLEEAGVGQVDIAIVASSSRLENAILAIINLERLGVPEIIVKTKNDQYREVLERIGATRVIIPEADMGVQIANELSEPPLQFLLSLDEKHQLVEFVPQKAWVGKTLSEIDFRNKYNVYVVAIRSEREPGMNVAVSPDYVIKADDNFLGLTDDNELGKKFNL